MDTAGFGWQDVKSLRPDWTQEQCEEAFEQVENNLHERLVEEGWGILEMLLDWLE